MHSDLGCLLVACDQRTLAELPPLVERAGLVPVVGQLEDAAKDNWALSVVTTGADSVAKDIVSTLARKHGIPVLLALTDPEAVEVGELLAAGAADFINPPFSPATVVPRIQRATRSFSHCGAQAEPLGDLSTELGMMGKSPAFLAEMRKLPAISQCDVTVLIAGETGTGKELLARAIHSLSKRRAESFVPIDCGAIPQELAESELFGHEKGSFTGAAAKTAGLIASADRGTLFLDEVDSLSVANQAKLLRFLQRREYRSVGSTTLQQADVRVISATNANLRQRVADGTFREDLFYRLKVVQMRLPPLRERGDDVVMLAQHFVTKYAGRFERTTRGIARDGIARLLAHRWPGNVREVENVIEAAVALAKGEWIDAGDIAFDAIDSPQGSLREAKARAVQDFERNYIVGLLRTYDGNISEAARGAKKHRRAFWELMRKYKVRAEDVCGTPRKGQGKDSSASTLAASA